MLCQTKSCNAHLNAQLYGEIEDKIDDFQRVEEFFRNIEFCC